VPGPSVRSRRWGHLLEEGTDLLRFEVADLNLVVARAAGDAELYRPLQDERGQPEGWQVLVLSCFAVTERWTPARLAEGTGFRAYRVAGAGALVSAGHEIWPTEVFVDDVADPRNEVHYDLVVAAGPGLVTADLVSGDRATRRAARGRLRPAFERAMALFGDPLPLG